MSEMQIKSSGQRRRSAAYRRGFEDGVSFARKLPAKSVTAPPTGIAREAYGVKVPFVVDCLRNYANVLRSGEIDGAGHYFPSDVDEAAEMLEAGDLELLQAAKAVAAALVQTTAHREAMHRLRVAVESSR